MTLLSLIMLFILAPIELEAQSLLDCEDNQPIEDCLKQEGDILENPQNDDSGTTNSSNFSFFKSFIQMIFALLLILALIYVMVKILARKNQGLQESNIIENLGGLSLGQNKSLQLIRIGEQVMVLGVGDNIELLYEITDPNILKSLQEYKEGQEKQGNILQILNDKLQKNKQKEKQSTNFKQLFIDELESIKENREQIIEEHRDRDDRNE